MYSQPSLQISQEDSNLGKWPRRRRRRRRNHSNSFLSQFFPQICHKTLSDHILRSLLLVCSHNIKTFLRQHQIQPNHYTNKYLSIYCTILKSSVTPTSDCTVRYLAQQAPTAPPPSTRRESLTTLFQCFMCALCRLGGDIRTGS